MKIHKQSEFKFVFFCPGCSCAHGFSTVPGAWTWNGDFNKPTVYPSVLAIGVKRCHSHIKDGKIQFLNDCEHELKNQIVEIPEWDLGG